MVQVKMCFLIDCTGSMEPWIQAAKDQVQTMINETRNEQANAEFQTAFVGYRDFGDAERFKVVDFTEPDRMLSDIADVHADGGDDAAEDVVGGLDHALELSWEDADVRMIVHIADAPPHGRNYHSVALSDRYPEGDPNGNDPLVYIEKFVNRRIDYTFVKINSSTDMMIEKFACIWGEQPGFKVLDLRPQRLTLEPPNLGFTTPPRGGHDPTLYLSPAVSRAVTDSIGRYTSSQAPTV
jgi:hypothetical protein